MITIQNVYRQFYDYFQTPDFAAVPKTIDSEYVVNLIRKIPGVREPITAEPILAGKDKIAQKFLATSPNQKFVIRFMTDPIKAAREICCQRIASDNCYGPHVYVTDPKLGVIVMAYIEQAPMEENQFSSLRRHRALGETLSKMHKGPSFPKGEYEGFFLPYIRSRIQRLKTEKPHFQTVTLKIEEMISTLEKAISPCMEKAPCHGDLTLPNLFYSGTSFTLIDYGDATQDDPFFDLGTAIIFNCFNSKQEKALLDAYFKRPISEKEKAKLFVAKQAALLRADVSFFIEHPAEKVLQITETVEEMCKNFWLGDPHAKQEAESKYGHVFLTEAIANIQSVEFREAVKLLKDGRPPRPSDSYVLA